MTESIVHTNEKENEVDPNDVNQLGNNWELLMANEGQGGSNWLNSQNDEHAEAVKKFMDTFDFKGMDVLDAFRLFNEKVCLTGDSTQLTIMAVPFCKRYSDMNSETWTFDDCQIVIYAILLLNSSLHKKNVKSMGLKDFLDRFSDMSSQHSFTKVFLKHLYNSIKEKSITAPVTRTNKRSSNDDLDGDNTMKKQRNGLLSKRHFGIDFLSRKQLKSKERCISINTFIWKKFFVSLSDLSLSFYKDDDIRNYIRKHDLSDNIKELMDNNEFMKFVFDSCSPVEVIHIHHCLAKPIVKHDTKFLLYLDDETKYCFKAKDSVHVEYWNSTINYAAALLSKPKVIPSQLDTFNHGIIRFPSGVTTFDIDKQIIKHTIQRDELIAMLNFHENQIFKNELYKSNLKQIKLLIERFETYIRHLKVANSKPTLAYLSVNLDLETDSIKTCSSQYSNPELSSRTSIIIESLSNKPSIGDCNNDQIDIAIRYSDDSDADE